MHNLLNYFHQRGNHERSPLLFRVSGEPKSATPLTHEISFSKLYFLDLGERSREGNQ